MKKIPHTFTIVFALIVLAAVLTWVVPAGEFVRHTVDAGGAAREVVQNGSYHRVDAAPQTWQVFSSLFNGFCDKADIIVFILIVGGAFWILNNSHAIDRGVMAFLRRLRRRSGAGEGTDRVVIASVMVLFSLFGAVFGMSEETLAFVVVFIPLAIQMGYDSIVGVCMCYVAAHVGFAGAMLNPFTIGIAQGIADLPLFSGLEYRVLCWLVLTAIGIGFVLWYAHRVKVAPERSPVYRLDDYWRQRVADGPADAEATQPRRYAPWLTYGLLLAAMGAAALLHPTTTLALGGTSVSLTLPLLPALALLFAVSGALAIRRSAWLFILDILLFTIAYLITGVLGYGWYVMEISALFLAMGIASGMADSQGADSIAKLFLAGCKDIMSAALVVGLASGIIFILKDGRVIDSILYGLTRSLAGAGDVASLGAMYLFQTALNLVMPSGSAKAALTMPIMAQFADLIDVSRQTTVLAFQFGDGFTNMLTPTSGVLIGVLGIARIPYATWLRWAWKFIVGLVVVGFLLMLPTLWIDLPGF